MVEVRGLRLSADQSQLEAMNVDEYYAPEPGKPRRQRSALAVLVEVITESVAEK